MPKTRFTTMEEFVPSIDERIPSFGIIIRPPENPGEGQAVSLVFDEGTPMPCQEDVREEAEAHFIGIFGVSEAEISAFIYERLHWFVASRQLRRNKFTQKWVWLGDS